MIFRRLYSIWVVFSIVFYFFIFIIPLLLCVPFRKMHRTALRINWVWAWGFFRLAFIPLKQVWHFKPDKKQQYILCTNHFSYLDIPALGLFPYPFKFVGKSQLGKVPLFGLMYNNLHITVNRKSYKSRAQSLLKTREELSNGFNLGFFPEGGIRSVDFSKMSDFKDGAFRIACENNIPIVPIVMLDNYKILKDDQLLDIRRKPCRIIYHAPIYPTGSADSDIKKLKDDVYEVIQKELDQDQKLIHDSN